MPGQSSMSAIEPTVFGERFETNVPYSLEHPNLSALKNGYFQDGLKFNVPRFLGYRIEVDSCSSLRSNNRLELRLMSQTFSYIQISTSLI
jgi:hypothetical protein